MADIFDEIQGDLRAERMQRLAVRYGGLLVAIALVIVGAAGGWKAWQWWQAKQDAAAASRYIRAMESVEARNSAGNAPPPADAIATLDSMATDAPSGYRVLARFNAAALKARSGDLAGASALWDQIAGDTAADPELRDLASLLWARHQIDNGDPSVISARLQALAVPGKVWSSLAQEQLALLSLRQNDGAAKATLRKLQSNPMAPADVRARVSVLLSRVGD